MSCYLFYCLSVLSCGECNVISLYVCVSLSMGLVVLCAFLKIIWRHNLRYVWMRLLFSVVGGALLDIPCMVFQRVCYACNSIVRLCSFHMFCLCFVYRKLSPHLRGSELDFMRLLSLCCFFV